MFDFRFLNIIRLFFFLVGRIYDGRECIIIGIRIVYRYIGGECTDI